MIKKEKTLNFLQSSIYPKIPVSLQNLGISAFGLYWHNHRFGGSYASSLEEFRKREFYSKEQWNAYQTAQLRKLLVHSFREVPYYHQLFSGLGLSLLDLENFELKNLNQLPYLDKQTLRELGTTDLLARRLGKGSFVSSSGSTGTPVRIYLPKTFHQNWSALMEARIRNWAGVSINTPRGMIGGRRIIPDHVVSYPLYRYNFVEKQTYFSAYHLSPQTVGNYLEGLSKNNVGFLTGYAVSIFLMAKFALESNLPIPPLKAVITSSEKLTPEMRATIQAAFQCKVFDSYSGVEACGLISESPEGKLVFSPDSGILELLDTDGREVGPGQTGEIVLTGLHNFDQPLIRYKIGDYATLAQDQTLECGRTMPVIESIQGRMEDILYGADGRAMVRFHSVFYDIPGLKLSQIIQEKLSEFVINLVVDSNSYQKDQSEKLIVERFRSQLGDIQIQFQYPEKIEKSASGKYKAVVNQLKKNP